MATGDSILEGLGGLQFSAADNPFGLGTATIAASLPKLIDTRGNFGTNLGIALGGTLLTALMGYQARQTAADLTSRATSVGLDILAADSVEKRKALAEAADQGWYGGEIKSKALNLVTALEGQQKVNELAAKQAYQLKLKELEALTSPAGEEYMGMQTKKAVDAIQERGNQSRLTEADKAVNKTAQIILKGEVDKNKGWVKNDQLVALDQRLAAQKMQRLNAGEDPDLVEASLLAEKKAAIDKARDAQKQAYTLQAIDFENKLKDSLKDGDMPPTEKAKLSLQQTLGSIAYDLANYVDEQNYLEMQLGRRYSAADDNSFKERVEMLRAEYRRAMSGAAVTKSEDELFKGLIYGDWTAGTESFAANLRLLGDTMSVKSLNALNVANKSSTDIYNDVMQSMTTKTGLKLPSVMEVKKVPEVPAPATMGGTGLAGALPGDKTAQLAALEAQKQTITDAVNGGTMSEQEGRQKARALQAQIVTLQQGM